MSRYSSQNIKIDESKLEAAALSMLSDHTAPIQRSVTSELFPQQEYTGFGFTYKNCCDKFKFFFFLACYFFLIEFVDKKNKTTTLGDKFTPTLSFKGTLCRHLNQRRKKKSLNKLNKQTLFVFMTEKNE